MRLMTAKTAGSIQAAETIIHGRRRGNRTALTVSLVQQRRNAVHVNSRAARVLVIDCSHNKAQKASQNITGRSAIKMLLRLTLCVFCAFLWLMPAGGDEERAADAAAIRAHIESIFQAFID